MTLQEAQSLVRKQILDGTVWNHPDYLESSEGLAQAFREPDRAVMVAACAELLTDPEIRVRSGVVAVLGHFTGDLGAEWLAETLERHSELFVGVEPVGTSLNQSDLEKEIFIAIAGAVQPGDSRALKLLCKAARESAWGVWVIPSLARVDGDWLCQHTGIIPHRMISVLPPLTHDQREIVVRNLAPWPDDVVAGISSDFWSQFPPEEAAQLKGWMKSLDAAEPAPNYLFRIAMVMIIGCGTVFFIVFLIWGSRLGEKSRYINRLNEIGRYEEARRVSEETRKSANKALISALTVILLTLGFVLALHYHLIG